jgi:hypothetical protein
MNRLQGLCLPLPIARVVVAIVTVIAMVIAAGTAGPAAAVDIQSGTTPPAPTLPGESPAKQAVDTLNAMLVAFENGDTAKVAESIEPTLVGLAVLLKSVDESHAQQRSIRIHLQDLQVTAGGDDALIGADWEKRYLSAAKLAPGLAKGRATFVFRRTGKQWKLAGMTGDNLFAGGL